jgi:hypothetical protein
VFREPDEVEWMREVNASRCGPLVLSPLSEATNVQASDQSISAEDSTSRPPRPMLFIPPRQRSGQNHRRLHSASRAPQDHRLGSPCAPSTRVLCFPKLPRLA